MWCHLSSCFFFFFNDTATTEIYTLSLHDALPILRRGVLGTVAAAGVSLRLGRAGPPGSDRDVREGRGESEQPNRRRSRSEEHTSELQSRQYLVCRLLLEKKKKNSTKTHTSTTI